MWWCRCLSCRDCLRYINHCVCGSNIATAFSQNLRTDAEAIFEHPASLWCPAPLRWVLHYCPTMVGNRDVPIRRFHNFPPHRIQRLASAIMSLSPIILHSHLPKKTFRCAFHPHTSPCQRFSVMVTSQSSDRASLKWLRQRYTTRTVSDYGSLPGREIADMRQDTI